MALNWTLLPATVYNNAKTFHSCKLSSSRSYFVTLRNFDLHFHPSALFINVHMAYFGGFVWQ
ncbi:hypothetical protein SERLADRAFT_393752 [Serpula lacrymans var. lacrymans S7.9]|uniref:Uncharacterized protein n=1 Tax=Serpula lacrymans var. lacrymans (strain S7.9) TaxID=578457 RepID=F8P1C2_SERL9|nr:uncharacterized protein SERLADRAFT_393752 [Serpula lacrymans var. lacrymans S7.9]EGO22951.1 hypothetical protein SERLADRAFT_393752 [Serpula lacrymans var. lacrymans S7.9]